MSFKIGLCHSSIWDSQFICSDHTVNSNFKQGSNKMKFFCRTVPVRKILTKKSVMSQLLCSCVGINAVELGVPPAPSRTQHDTTPMSGDKPVASHCRFSEDARRNSPVVRASGGELDVGARPGQREGHHPRLPRRHGRRRRHRRAQ